MPGFFAINDKFVTITLADGLEISVVSRDANTLAEASQYHFEAGGFPNEEAARIAGEHLRQSMQFLVAVFGLSLHIDIDDKIAGSASQEIKEKARELGLQLFDSRSGLFILPDDDASAELVMAGVAKVTPADPMYVLKALDAVWPLKIELDDTSKRVLELLALGATHVSEATKFLTTYLAVELLIHRRQRSTEAITLLKELSMCVESSALHKTERAALVLGIGNLRAEPFSAAFRAFLATIESPEEFGGVSVKDLADESIRLRNAIAHQAAPDDLARAPALTNALRQFALSTIWNHHQIPPLTLDRTADSIQVTKFEIRIV